MGLCTSRTARREKLEWKRRSGSVARRNNEDRSAQKGQVSVKGQQMACCRGEESGRGRVRWQLAGGKTRPVNERSSSKRSGSYSTDGGQR
jgi:hypothetical protein